MKQSLIKQIICINCGADLILKTLAKENEEILEGILSCKKCDKEYNIKNGVPRLVSEEFEKESKKVVSSKVLNTVKGFGYEWKNFSKLYKEYENQFFDWIYPVKREFFKNKIILDAGCGTGRHINTASKYGKEVIGIDLSEAADVAFNNVGRLRNVNIIQADIYTLPFKKKTFDYIYSIGVLHHLPQPQKGFNCLINMLKDKAAISAWVYGKENNTLLKIANPIRKLILSKLPLQINQSFAFFIALSIYPLMFIYLITDKIIFNETKHKLPQFDFLVYLSKLNFRIVHSIIFDQMLAPIANYYTEEEFEKWFKDANLKNINISWRNRNSWRGFGEK